MRLLTLAIAATMFIPPPAAAYLPPSFFLAKKIAVDRGNASSVLVQIAIYRAATNHKEADELLWEQYIVVPSNHENKLKAPWPGASILIESDHERLSSAFKRFGLPVASEESLARFKSDQLRAMKETPRPFYQMDPHMSLRKEGRQLAWVLSSADGAQSLWVDKTSFFPLFLRGPCPPAVEEVSWAKSEEGPCELHFESISGLKTSAGKKTAAVLRRNGQPLLKFVVKKTFADPLPQLVKESLEKNEKTTAAAGDLLPLINDLLN